MKGVQKLLSQDDTQKRLGEQAESYKIEVAKLELELNTRHEQLQQDDALIQITRTQEAFKALELQAKELKKRIQESMASEKKDEKALSPNQMNTAIRNGKAPAGIIRVDVPKIPGEKLHVHFSNGTALNQDGTWKHDHESSGSGTVSSAQAEWLRKCGWNI